MEDGQEEEAWRVYDAPRQACSNVLSSMTIQLGYITSSLSTD